MRMPFGKYSGVALDQVPPSYLVWLQQNISLREPLKSAVQSALDDDASRAKDEPVHPASIPIELRSTVRDLVDVGYRTLALRRHPDLGGSHLEMTRLNAAAELLRHLVQ